jgi:hypothetical protein
MTISGAKLEGSLQMQVQEMSGDWWIHQDASERMDISIVEVPFLHGSGEIHNSEIRATGTIGGGMIDNSLIKYSDIDGLGVVRVVNSSVFGTIKGNLTVEDSTFQGISEGNNKIYNSSIGAANFSGNITAKNIVYPGIYGPMLDTLALRGTANIDNVIFAAVPISGAVSATNATCGWVTSYSDGEHTYFYASSFRSNGSYYGCLHPEVAK